MNRRNFIKYFGEKPEDVIGKGWRQEIKKFSKKEDKKGVNEHGTK